MIINALKQQLVSIYIELRAKLFNNSQYLAIASIRPRLNRA